MKRPISSIVFGILNIIFAILGIAGIVISLAVLKFAGDSQQNNPVIRLLHDNAFYAAWYKLTIPLGLLGTGSLLAAGIGLLMFKNWARILCIVYAIYAVVTGLATMCINFMFLVLPALNQSGHGSTAEHAAQIVGAMGGTIGGLIALLYPILLLIFMTRPKIKAAFQQRAFEPAMPVQ